nr:MAG TPA: hypothetical protein [Caudoviricetes sp.]
MLLTDLLHGNTQFTAILWSEQLANMEFPVPIRSCIVWY